MGVDLITMYIWTVDGSVDVGNFRRVVDVNRSLQYDVIMGQGIFISRRLGTS